MSEAKQQPERKSVIAGQDPISRGAGGLSVLDLARKMNDEKAPLVDTSPLPTGTPPGPSIMEAARRLDERPHAPDEGPIVKLARKLNERKAPLASEERP